MIKVTVWNEYLEELQYEHVAKVYPNGIHECIREFLEKDPEIQVRCVTLRMENQGLSEEILNDTDVLIWWGHQAHDEVTEENVQRVKQHVLDGMGLIALHSAHYSNPMKELLGTSMCVRWKHGEREKLVCVAPSHPIAEGITESVILEKEEMYGEYFDIPKPDDVIFAGWFSGGQVFRSGCTFTRGLGKIFYFQPGHEEYPIYQMPEIQQIITNAVRYCAPALSKRKNLTCEEVK